MKKTKRNLLMLIFAGMLLIPSAPGCMYTKVVAEYDTDNPVPHKVTQWHYLWGLVQARDEKVDPSCESICQVTVKNNIGYILISGVTLGLVVPMSLEYECCPYIPEPGEL